MSGYMLPSHRLMSLLIRPVEYSSRTTHDSTRPYNAVASVPPIVSSYGRPFAAAVGSAIGPFHPAVQPSSAGPWPLSPADLPGSVTALIVQFLRPASAVPAPFSPIGRY